MAAATTGLQRIRLNLCVEEIVIRDGLRERVEEVAGDRTRIVTWTLAVAAILLAAVGYARAQQPAPAVAPPATAATEDLSASPTPSVFVHVAGAVAKPGLYRFPEGMRVADAIEAAGGALPKADLDAINLAELLTDRLKIEVPIRGRAAVATPTSSASPGLVNLNTADQVALETIPGIGPVTATAILQHRTEIGSYESVEQLLDVTGIGPATLEAVRPYVTV
ncbi:MAG: helix-hairpin-helix domain-containing protein [Actinobacteria bacterium]|nr:helix-hairpin-helix domain-containing protein [Actinomycetota bacterium]